MKLRVDRNTEALMTDGIGYSFSTTQAISWTMQNFLNNNTPWLNTANIFNLMKLLAISIEITPKAFNFSSQVVANATGTIVIGYYLNPPVAPPTYAEIVDNPKNVILDPTQRTRKYWSLRGAYDSYKNATENEWGVLYIRSTYNQNESNRESHPQFTVSISAYCLFKSNIA